MKLPSWDLIILLFFVANIIYGFILRRESLVVLIISTYVSYVATLAGGSYVFEFLKKFLPKAAFSEGLIEGTLFFLVIIFLNLWGEYLSESFSFGRGVADFVLVIFYGVLSTGLITTCFFSLLPPQIQINLISNSGFLQKVLKFEIFWFLAPAITMIVVGFLSSRKR